MPLLFLNTDYPSSRHKPMLLLLYFLLILSNKNVSTSSHIPAPSYTHIPAPLSHQTNHLFSPMFLLHYIVKTFLHDILFFYRHQKFRQQTLMLVSTIFHFFKNYEKCSLFHLKSSFCSRNIQIFVFPSSPLFLPVGHCFT